MKPTIIKLLFSLSLLVSLQTFSTGLTPGGSEPDPFDEQLTDSFVYITSKARRSIVEPESLLPDRPWSSEFRVLSKDIQNDGNVAFHDQVTRIVNECLTACTTLPQNESSDIQAHLELYQQILSEGNAGIDILNNDGKLTVRAKCCSQSCDNKPKKICSLCVAILSAGDTYM